MVLFDFMSSFQVRYAIGACCTTGRNFLFAGYSTTIRPRCPCTHVPPRPACVIGAPSAIGLALPSPPPPPLPQPPEPSPPSDKAVAPPPSGPAVSFTLVLAGSVDAFDQAGFKENLANHLANTLRTDTITSDSITLTVTAASVRVEGVVATSNDEVANAVLTELGSLMDEQSTSRDQLSATLGVDVESIDAAPVLTTMVPPSPALSFTDGVAPIVATTDAQSAGTDEETGSGSDGSQGIIVGLIVLVVILMACVIGLTTVLVLARNAADGRLQVRRIKPPDNKPAGATLAGWARPSTTSAARTGGGSMSMLATP